MFTNALTEQPYEFQEVNLWEFRNQLIQQEHLTYLDIIKGYHNLEKIPLDYNDATDLEMKRFVEDTIAFLIEKYSKILEKEIHILSSDRTSILEQVHLDFERGKTTLVGMTEEEIYQDFYTFFHKMMEENTKMGVISKTIASANVRNEIHMFSRKIKNFGIGEKMNQFSSQMEEEFVSIMQEKYGNKFEFKKNRTYQESMLSLNEYTGEEVFLEQRVNIPFYHLSLSIQNDIFGKLTFSVPFQVDCYEILTKEEANDLIERSINAFLKKNGNYNRIQYLQELESSPITINIQDGKYHLIDGYKRLLYVNDKELLDRKVPIRIFQNLKDKDFFALLYAANYWKTKFKGSADIFTTTSIFHDRGYLFSLRQRFGIRFETNSYLLAFLCLYDNVHTSMGDFSNIPISHPELIDSYLHHEFTAIDIRNIAERIDEFFIHDDYNLPSIVKNYVIGLCILYIGDARRSGKTTEIIDIGVIDKLLRSKELQSCIKGKSLSSLTYVEKNFQKSEIYSFLKGEIYASLIGMPFDFEKFKKKKEEKREETQSQIQSLDGLDLF